MKVGKRKKPNEVVELNITTFMNLMVILVPFLLITAVFSRMTVLEINLPALDVAQESSPKKLDLNLELVISGDNFIVKDEEIGELSRIERNQTESDWEKLRDTLIEIKSRYPEEKDITLMLEKDTAYKTIIHAMDSVKTARVLQFGQLVDIELFPNISIGDATEIIENQGMEKSDGTITAR